MQIEYEQLSDWEKIEFLKQIEFSEQPNKWELISTIITNSEEFDLVRIEALKILEIASFSQSDKEIISQSLLWVLRHEKDYDVRNYAACAAINFTEYVDIQKEIINGVLDIHEDIDIRYAFFSALEVMPNNIKSDVLQRLQTDKVLGKSAIRNLKDNDNKPG